MFYGRHQTRLRVATPIGGEIMTPSMEIRRAFLVASVATVLATLPRSNNAHGSSIEGANK
jgi:hypothetical protein